MRYQAQSIESFRAFCDETAKIAASRVDREIRAGRLQYHDIDPAIPAGPMPRVLEPVAKQRTRALLSAPAPVDPDTLARRRALNERVHSAQLAASGENLGLPGTKIENKFFPGMGPATAPDLPGGGVVHPRVFSSEKAGPLVREMASGGLGPYRALRGTFKPETLTSSHPMDATLNRGVLQHELGEAAELGKKTIAPFASHLGPEPILREQLHVMGDPEAIGVMAKARRMNPDDHMVQKMVRQVGGTPDSPIPVGGRQHRALDRLLAGSGTKLSPAARMKSLQLGTALPGKEISHMPASARSEVLNQIRPLVSTLTDKSVPLMERGRAAYPTLKRLGEYVKRGI